jgi:hypothetical protein
MARRIDRATFGENGPWDADPCWLAASLATETVQKELLPSFRASLLYSLSGLALLSDPSGLTM